VTVSIHSIAHVGRHGGATSYSYDVVYAESFKHYRHYRQCHANAVACGKATKQRQSNDLYVTLERIVRMRGNSRSSLLVCTLSCILLGEPSDRSTPCQGISATNGLLAKAHLQPTGSLPRRICNQRDHAFYWNNQAIDQFLAKAQPMGSYWHLATRPEEHADMSLPTLVGHVATAIDEMSQERSHAMSRS
jgi:hypothetical protein